jgi:hypothetical protein
VSDYGLKVFFNFLWEEGVLERFTADVEQAVLRFADPQLRPGCPAGDCPRHGAGNEQPGEDIRNN